MSQPESERVVLVFTDIEGSTRLLQRLGERYPAVLATHRDLLRRAMEKRGGREVDTQGDAFFFVFAETAEAVAAALDAQRALGAYPWPAEAAVRVRMGLHAGSPVRTVEGYAGLDVHRAARIAAAGHGGQILLSESAVETLGQGLPPVVTLRDLGYHRLKDIDTPEHIFQLVTPELPADFPPLRSLRAQAHNLPAATTRLVGRDADIEEVRGALTTTRLLLTAAERAKGRDDIGGYSHE
jgi:class 3 adenylate cyclase